MRPGLKELSANFSDRYIYFSSKSISILTMWHVIFDRNGNKLEQVFFLCVLKVP